MGKEKIRLRGIMEKKPVVCLKICLSCYKTCSQSLCDVLAAV
jgi:hypothetical protein